MDSFRHSVNAGLRDKSTATKRVNDSVDFLAHRLADSHSLYGKYGSYVETFQSCSMHKVCIYIYIDMSCFLGITTGFGGSADLRTLKVEALQQALIQHQHSGILPVDNTVRSSPTLSKAPDVNFMPEEWVRGAMLVRCKSLLGGHSGARFEIIELLLSLLNNDLIPLVPLRGTISASGDLQPLSYIAGVLEGNPDCYVWTSAGDKGRILISADVALEQLACKSITFGPKEALAVVNGTAVSTAVAALAMVRIFRIFPPQFCPTLATQDTL